MANLLDETQGPINDNGRDIHVIDRQLPVTITFKSTLFEIALWVTIPVLTLLYVSFMGNKLESPEMVALIGCVCGILPGVIFIFMKISAFLKTGFLTSQQFFSSSCLSRLCKRETYFP